MIKIIYNGIQYDITTKTITGTIDDFISLVQYHHFNESGKNKTLNTKGAENSVKKFLETKNEALYKWGKSKLDYIFHNRFHIPGKLLYETGTGTVTKKVYRKAK